MNHYNMMSWQVANVKTNASYFQLVAFAARYNHTACASWRPNRFRRRRLEELEEAREAKRHVTHEGG